MTAMSEAASQKLDWELCDPTEALVETPTTKLNLAVSGEPRRPGAPVVVFESGIGMPLTNWSPTARLLPSNIRSYRYDRAGTGRSDVSKAPRTTAYMAAELLELLHSANIRPPYVLVAHSYGAFIIREFLTLVPTGTVVGMVITDGTQERTIETLKPGNAGETFLEGYDWAEVVRLDKENKFTPGEWARWKAEGESPLHPEASKAEWELIPESSEALKSKNQFNTHPLSPYPITFVTGNYAQDLQRMIEFAKERNLITEEQLVGVQGELDRVNKYEDGLHRQQLELSSNQRYVHAKNSGHAPHFTEPQLMADEIERVVKEAGTM